MNTIQQLGSKHHKEVDVNICTNIGDIYGLTQKKLLNCVD